MYDYTYYIWKSWYEVDRKLIIEIVLQFYILTKQ